VLSTAYLSPLRDGLRLTYTKSVRYSAEVLSYQQVEPPVLVARESLVQLASTRNVSGILLANVGRGTELGVDS
jgi:hypothetical protein